MTVGELVKILEDLDSDLEIYKVENGNEFMMLEPEDVAEVTIGHKCDEEGNKIEDDESIEGSKMLLINFESIQGIKEKNQEEHE